MANQNAKFASAIVVCLVAGAPFAIPQYAANAAECLTEPRQDTPQGQHWFYRIEHGTKRHCWYLRGQDGTVSQAAPSDDSAAAPEEVAQQSPPSLEDARAEWTAPTYAANNARVAPAQAAPSSAPLATSPSPNSPQSAPQALAQAPEVQVAEAQGSAQPSVQQSAVSSRWPAPSEVASPSTTPLAVADAGDPEPAPQVQPAPAVAPAPPPPAPAIVPAGRASVSLQMLFIVILAALALAGITASVIYRFGRRRRTVRMSASERRAAIREAFDNAPKPPWTEPVIETPAPHIAKSAPQSNAARRAAPQTAAPKERYDNIEDVLALLMKHAQSDA